MTTSTHAQTGTLEVPGAALYYEVRGTGPLLLLIGAPMDATAFAPLADELAGEHTVLTTDPRGINRSPVTDRRAESTPQLRGGDLAHLIDHLDAGPAAVLGSSGGAASALALAQSHPDRVHTVIAHEPPLIELLPDRAQRRAVTEQIRSRYLDGDVIGAWTLFFSSANIPVPPPVVEEMFGGERPAQVVADERFWFAAEFRASTLFRPDLDLLGSGAPRVVVGIGQASAGQECDLTSRALANALGVDPIAFPGDHTGFVDHPSAFAAVLRRTLTGS